MTCVFRLLAISVAAITGCTSMQHCDVSVTEGTDFDFAGRVRITETRDDSFNFFVDHRPRIARVTLYGGDGAVVEIMPSTESGRGIVFAVVRDDERRAVQSLPVSAK
jgi:hypothetical protein